MLAAFIALVEVERIDTLLSELDAITAAYRQNWAFAGSAALAEDHAKLMRRLRALPDGTPEPLTPEMQQHLAAILVEIQKSNERAAAERAALAPSDPPVGPRRRQRSAFPKNRGRVT